MSLGRYLLYKLFILDKIVSDNMEKHWIFFIFDTESESFAVKIS